MSRWRASQKPLRAQDAHTNSRSRQPGGGGADLRPARTPHPARPPPAPTVEPVQPPQLVLRQRRPAAQRGVQVHERAAVLRVHEAQRVADLVGRHVHQVGEPHACGPAGQRRPGRPPPAARLRCSRPARGSPAGTSSARLPRLPRRGERGQSAWNRPAAPQPPTPPARWTPNRSPAPSPRPGPPGCEAPTRGAPAVTFLPAVARGAQDPVLAVVEVDAAVRGEEGVGQLARGAVEAVVQRGRQAVRVVGGVEACGARG